MTRDELITQSPLLTNEEAAKYLRLDTDHQTIADAIKALQRIVRDKGLRPVACGSTYKYSIDELNRFITDQTERFG